MTREEILSKAISKCFSVDDVRNIIFGSLNAFHDVISPRCDNAYTVSYCVPVSDGELVHRKSNFFYLDNKNRPLSKPYDAPYYKGQIFYVAEPYRKYLDKYIYHADNPHLHSYINSADRMPPEAARIFFFVTDVDSVNWLGCWYWRVSFKRIFPTSKVSKGDIYETN